jgi:uncharacterized protein YcbX
LDLSKACRSMQIQCGLYRGDRRVEGSEITHVSYATSGGRLAGDRRYLIVDWILSFLAASRNRQAMFRKAA